MCKGIISRKHHHLSQGRSNVQLLVFHNAVLFITITCTVLLFEVLYLYLQITYICTIAHIFTDIFADNKYLQITITCWPHLSSFRASHWSTISRLLNSHWSTRLQPDQLVQCSCWSRVGVRKCSFSFFKNQQRKLGKKFFPHGPTSWS